MHNKGSIFFGLGLFLIVAGIFSYFVYQDLHHKPSERYNTLGEVQANVVKSYNEGEKALLYLDESVKLSLNKALININGVDLGCDVTKGYSFVYFRGKECYLEGDILNKAFGISLNIELDRFLKQYADLEIPSNSYDVKIILDKGSIIKGESNKQIEVKKEGINYMVKNNFNIKMNYDFLDFIDVNKKIKELVIKCADNDKCWNDNLNKDWKMTKESKVFMFDINTGRMFKIYDQDKDVELTLKIAVDMNNPLGG